MSYMLAHNVTQYPSIRCVTHFWVDKKRLEAGTPEITFQKLDDQSKLFASAVSNIFKHHHPVDVCG